MSRSQTKRLRKLANEGRLAFDGERALELKHPLPSKWNRRTQRAYKPIVLATYRLKPTGGWQRNGIRRIL